MKKLMFAAVAALAMVGAAQADTTGYAKFTNYAKVDETPSSESASLYSCYIITSDTVESPAELATWLADNGGITRENITSKGTSVSATTFAWNDIDQYVWKLSDLKPVTGGAANKYAMILAATSVEASDFAYEIMKGVESTVLYTEWNFDDKVTGNVTWTPVPEPTSGILLLLGVAGLALKRKRA